MAFNVGAATIKLTLSGTNKVLAGFRRVQKAAASIGKALARAAKVGIAAFAALAAASAVAIRAAVVQEDAETKLAAVLRATGNAAGFTAAEMFKQAAALQRLTRFGDEVIINGQALIATFKNITGESFERTTLAMLDMSTVMDQDLKTSAILLGKAINDPIKGVGALTRVGVTFTEKQKETIKVLQESGKLMEAQGIILTELESQFKGAAVAAGDNFGGSVAKLKNLIGDLAEEAGFVLVEELKNLTGGLDTSEEGVDRLSRGVRRATAFIVDGIKIMVVFLKRAADQVVDFFANIPNAIQAPLAAALATANNFFEALAAGRGKFDIVSTEEAFETGRTAASKERQRRIEAASKELKALVSQLGRTPEGRVKPGEADTFGAGVIVAQDDLADAIKENTKVEKEKKEKAAKPTAPKVLEPQFVGLDEMFRRLQTQFGAVTVEEKQLGVQEQIRDELKKGNAMQQGLLNQAAVAGVGAGGAVFTP